MDLDDVTLLAYLDGQLSDEASSQIEAELARHPAAAQRLDQLARSADMARRAYEPVMRSPVPPQLIAAVWSAARPQAGSKASEHRQAAATPASWMDRVRALWPSSSGWRVWGASLAAAALVALLVAPLLPRPADDSAESWALTNGQSLRGDAIAVALESAPSGRELQVGQGTLSIVASFETREGFCREVSRENADSSTSELSILCRAEDGGWRVVFARTTPRSSYVTASSDLQVQADATLEKLQAMPLDAATEAAVLRSSWRR